MCGRYAASADEGALRELFELEQVLELPPASWNVAPTDHVPAVVERADKATGIVTRRLIAPRWGLVPSWSKGPGGPPMINARVETLATKPAFRAALSKRRCLLPADGYYEWYETEQRTARGKPVKQPFFIKPETGLLVMAGLYEFWKDPSLDGPEAWLTSVTIITTRATDKVGHIHDRMPMTVPPEAWAAWLDPSQDDAEAAHELLTVTRPDDLDAYAVSTAVNTVANNSPDLVQPLAES
ncbi:MAG: SOS response-associated peptidase [Propionibacteriaceae bacterium]